MALRLMDTNVAFFMLKGHSLAARYRRHLQGHQLAVSFMTVAECMNGVFTPGQSTLRKARGSVERSGDHPSSPDLGRR